MVVVRGQGGRRHRRPVVVLHVQHVGQQGLGGRVQLLHLALDCQGFQGDLLARPGHPQEPGDPLEEDDPHPGGHVVGVRLPVVVVEDHDGGDHAGGHHEHDAVEVSPWRGENGQRQVEVKLFSLRQGGSVHLNEKKYLY